MLDNKSVRLPENINNDKKGCNRMKPKCDIECKFLEGFGDKYKVCSCGKIWNCYSNEFVPQWTNGTPYLYVSLYWNGKKINRRVSRLIAQTYVTNPDPKHLTKVDHENQNTRDNYAKNLRWVDNIINHCNRKNNIAVFDVETCENYCSVASAIRATGVKRSQILKQCNEYHDNHAQTRFVYDEDLTQETMFEFISNMLSKRRNAG